MRAFLQSFDRRALLAGFGLMGLVFAGIVFGSRGLRHFDLALLPYTFGVLGASFTIAYRYAVWLQRPATAIYWRRGWELIFDAARSEFGRRSEAGGSRPPGPWARRLSSLWFLVRSILDNLFAQRFIKRRSSTRWVAHFCFAWGTMIASAVTFPLVLGWLHFETRPDDLHWYRVVLFGIPVHEFHTESITRYVMFNLLNLSAVLVIVGVVIALDRRLRDARTTARQQFGADIVPLLLLLAISLTGLMLTFSMHVLHGASYSEISLVHALVVTGTLLYLPFGKLFHVFQRPAQVSVAFYKAENARNEPARCVSCGEGFAGAMHVQDLKQVLGQMDFAFQMAGPVRHYADVCPRCRRRLLGVAQGQALGR